MISVFCLIFTTILHAATYLRVCAIELQFSILPETAICPVKQPLTTAACSQLHVY